MTNRLKTDVLTYVLLLWGFTASVSANGIDPASFETGARPMRPVPYGVTVLFNALEEDLREFAVDKNYYYLTGTAIPDAILVLSPAHSQHKETLFIPARDLAQEKWTGPKLLPGAETAKQLGVERVLGLEQFQSEITTLMAGQRSSIRCCRTARGGTTSTQEGRVSRLRGLFPFAEIAQAATPIAHLRMTKSASELALI